MEEDEAAFYAIFTMIDKPDLDLPEGAPAEARKPLTDAVNDLADYISSGDFVVNVPIPGEVRIHRIF